jgi:hypothetical protein
VAVAAALGVMFHISQLDRLVMLRGPIAIISVVIVCISSCSTVSPHENFKAFLQSNIGKAADDPNSDTARYPQLLVQSVELPNGNIENEYQWVKSCKYFYEISKETNVIVGSRYEGSTEDCAITP